MHFLIRRGVNLHSFDESLTGLARIPIELALAYRLDDFLAGMDRLDALAEHINDKAIAVSTVHATQGRLSDVRFMSWALPTMKFAEKIGIPVVVFHPEAVRKLDKPNLQVMALNNLKALQRLTSVTVAVETFGNSKRIITPEEMIEFGVPMVLDTSHLFQQRIFAVIEAYSRGIVAVHLSELRGEGKESLPHLPVETYGFAVLERLKERGWDGPVTLEYLPQYHDRLVSDRETLEGMYGS